MSAWREIVLGVPSLRFSDNSINTRRHKSWWTFFPMSLLGQFRKLSNFYFLTVAVVMLIPDISPLEPLSAIGPLLFVLGVSMARELVEEFQAWRRDVEANSRLICTVKSQLGDASGRQYCRMSAIRPGELVLVQEGEKIPADLLLLSCSNSDSGFAYVETTNLDGELNLKVRACVQTGHTADSQVIVTVEPPHGDMYRCEGSLKANLQSPPVLVSADNVLLRESTLRNTRWIVGLVLYAGRETKTQLNAGKKTQMKRTRLERVLSKVVSGIFVLQVIVCLVVVAQPTQVNVWYLRGMSGTNVTSNYLTAFILLSTLIPVSLWVNLEFLKLAQSLIIERTAHFRCNAKNLTEDLGVVTHVFSDKTGTLTQNKMQFKALTTADGQVFGPACSSGQSQSVVSPSLTFSGVKPADQDLVNAVRSASGESPGLTELLIALALCHSCEKIVEPAAHAPTHQATSPDEAALVLGAAQCGVEFIERSTESTSILVGSLKRTFRVLHVIAFSSERRMMSVVVQETPQAPVTLYTKGADQSILTARDKSQEDLAAEQIAQDVKMLSEDGLRVLVVARRQMTNAVWTELQSKLAGDGHVQTAAEKIRRREEVEKEMESNLELLGVTGVEDKLQEKVDETLEALREAQIKICMITGDKRETAINVARSCGLIQSRQNIYTMLYKQTSANSHGLSVGGGQFVPVRHLDEIERVNQSGITRNQSAKSFLANVMSRSASMNTNLQLAVKSAASTRKYSLVIDGAVLGSILGIPAEERRLTSVVNHPQCESAVFCRVNPKQKAQIVRLFKTRNSVCLAIGDGANDVNMITSAHVGVGLRGVEGQAAASAADFAIDRFSDLYTLLFKYGRVNSVRTSFFVLLFLYKNFVFSFCQFWNYTVSLWSGQSIFEDWSVLAFNGVFMIGPLFVYGLLDKDVDFDLDRSRKFPEISEQAWTRVFVPTLYIASVQNSYFNFFRILTWLCLGVTHSVILFFSVMYGFQYAGERDPTWLWLTGVTLYSSVFFVVAFMIILQMNEWRWLSVTITVLNFALYISFILLWSTFQSSKVFGITDASLGNANYWLTVIVASCACLLPVVARRKFRLLLYPSVVSTAHRAAMASSDDPLSNHQI